MSRLKKLFERKPRGILSIYNTAGYPRLDSILEIARSLQKYGVDMVELGIPYSDPLADGPVIQHSSSIALRNGMSIAVLFDQLSVMRRSIDQGGVGIDLPVILMGYMNPVLQYGFEKFCKTASACGVDALIIPDMPEYEFEKEYGNIIRKNNLDFIFLVAPETSDERIRKLDGLSTGFLYAVSSSATTGAESDLNHVTNYLERIHSLGLKNPVLLGFGIRDRKSWELACRWVSGAIIGTAYIKALEREADTDNATRNFVRSILANN
jgi:tryptophan synthase alpha chain